MESVAQLAAADEEADMSAVKSCSSDTDNLNRINSADYSLDCIAVHSFAVYPDLADCIAHNCLHIAGFQRIVAGPLVDIAHIGHTRPLDTVDWVGRIGLQAGKMLHQAEMFELDRLDSFVPFSLTSCHPEPRDHPPTNRGPTFLKIETLSGRVRWK